MPDPVYATGLANVFSDTPQLKTLVTHFTPASPQPSYPQPVSAPSRNRRGWHPTQLLSRFRSTTARDRPDTQQQPPPAPPRAPLLVDRFFRPLATPNPPPSLAAYNHLCQRVDKAAEIARTQMIVHVSVTAYGLATLATVRDIDFFARNEGSGVKVPLVDIEFPFGTYMMAIALLSTLTMFHFRICYGRTVRLSRSAEQLEALHRDDPAFVPARGDHRYPWFAFAVRERTGWSWIAAPLFHVVQYVLTPTLWALCCARTIRLGTNVQHWVSYQIYWHWPFTTVGALVALTCALLAVRDARSHGKRGWLTAATACLSLCVGVGWVGLSSWAGSDGQPSPFNLKLRHAKLSGLRLPNIELTYADLQEAHMEHANLNEAHMEHADLSFAHMEHTKLWRAHMEHAVLLGAHIEHANLQWAHMEHVDLLGTHMEHAVLRMAHMEHAVLQGAHMEHVDLLGAHMEHAVLRVAHMEHADLREAHMEHADLLGAHMEHTVLREAHMEHADLRGAVLHGSMLENAVFSSANLLATDLTQDQLDGKLTPPHKPFDLLFNPDEWAPPCGDAATQLPPLLVIAPCHPLVATW